ncbi:unnamed protein product [Linum trigynum]
MVKTEDTTAPKRDHAGERMRQRRTTPERNPSLPGEGGGGQCGGAEEKSRTEKLLLSAKGKREKGKGFWVWELR